jgi:Protein of unknown function (DUF1569)
MGDLRNWNSPILRKIVERVDRCTARMDDADMIWHPPGKWSVAEIIEHLSLAFVVTTKAGKAVLRDKLPPLQKPTGVQRVMVWIVVDVGYFFMRVKAPRMVSPRGLRPREARDALLQNLTEMDELLNVAEQKCGARKEFLPHPFLGPMTVEQWRKFHWVHTRHHMRQVKSLRRQLRRFLPGTVVKDCQNRA